MKILLIQPNPRGYYDWPVCANIPLGLLYIAAALREAGCGEITILDARLENLNLEQISWRIENAAPDIVGITGLSTEAAAVHALAGLARKTMPRCKVVIGGPYAITSPEEALHDPDIDFAVLGEGERTVCELVAALERGGTLAGIAGLAFKEGGLPVINPRRAAIEEIDAIPFPAWDLLNMEEYFQLWVRHSQNPFPASERVMPLFTSRGCPYGCIFCHNIFGKKTRLRSVASVMAELDLLVKKYKVGEIEIIDDIFNIDLPRAKQICDEIIRRKLKLKLSFPNGLRVDRMDEELVLKLRKAGAHLMAYAIETGSPAVQKRIGKNLDLEKARRMVKFTAAQGIFLGVFFMLGFPDETKEEMLSTVNFAMELPFHQANFFYVTPRPNTALYEIAAKRGGGLETAGQSHYFKFSVNLSAVPDEELKRIMELAGSGFYNRLSQKWRIVRDVPNKLHILKLVLWHLFRLGRT